MMALPRQWLRRHWPRMKLRTILFLTLFFVAALPGIGAVFLRVYENTLVRQTEAELVAQGAALAAAEAALWPGAAPHTGLRSFSPEPPGIDLNSTPILPERPDPSAARSPVDADAGQAAARMAPVIADTRRTTLAAILLLDSKGRIIGGPQAGRSYADLPEVAAALKGAPATVLRHNGDYQQVYRFEWLTRAADIRVHHARPVIVNGRVVGVLLLSRSARSLFRGIYQDIGKIALGAGLIFVALIVLAGLLSRGIATPIERLSIATRRLAQGDGDIPTASVTAAVEIQALYDDFGAMTRAIEQRSRYLRDFASSVSHEFKTPLAGISGAAELLQDHADTMSAEERAQFLANIAADAGRLTQLLSGLLDLARADMARPPAAATDVGDPLAKIADAYGNRDIAVTLTLADDLAPVTLPAQALETCLSNLLENSRKAGARHVSVRAARDGDAVLIDVADDGAGVAAADRHRIFEPFFTTRRENGGTGLGLSIVKSLLEAHGGSIRLLPSDTGAHFRLSLPAAS
jgi:signal transduction histidine kinase